MSNKDKQLLIDRFGNFRATLLEDRSSSGGKMVARGEFARADVATENKRVYPHKLWEREIKKLGGKLAQRKVFGEADHPADGRTQLKRVSHVITRLWLENGVVMGEAEILDTSEGRNLKSMLESGCQLGVSSRGFGTTRPNEEGMDVVQDDYSLMTFDFVADPANVTSYPEVHVESGKSNGAPAMAEEVTLDKLKNTNPSLYESLMGDAEREYEKRGAELWAKKIAGAKDEAAKDLRASFAEQLQQTIADTKAEIEAKVREELMADPAVAGAKAALESVKDILRPYVLSADTETVVKEKDGVIESLNTEIGSLKAKIDEMSKQNEALQSIAKEAGYRYHLETLLHGHEKADLIRKIVGDVKQYENINAINAKVAEAVDDLSKETEARQERDREMDRLRQENEVLRQATEKALEATKQLTVQNYIEARLLNHPRRDEVRVVLESVAPTSKEDVDTVLAKFRERKRDVNEINEARARVRELVGSGTKEYITENEERGRNGHGGRNSQDFNGLGMDLAQLRALSGIGNDSN